MILFYQHTKYFLHAANAQKKSLSFCSKSLLKSQKELLFIV